MSLNTDSIYGSEPSSAFATSTTELVDSDSDHYPWPKRSHEAVFRKRSNIVHDSISNIDAEEAAKKSHLVIDPPAPTSNRISISTIISSITVEPSLILYTFCFMIYQPVFSFQMMHTLCRQTDGYTEEQCIAFGKGKNMTVDVNVQKTWANFDNYSTIFNTAPGVIFALFMGPWSDVFGRKKLLAIPFLGTIAGSMFAGLLYFLPFLPIWTLYIPTFLQSLGGSMPAIVTGGFAYAVDVSHEGSSRTVRIALVNIAISLGFAVAGLVSSLLLAKGVPYYVCYILCTALSCVGLIYTTFFLKETRRPDRFYTRLQATVELFKIHHLVDSCRAMAKKRPGWGRMNLWLLILAFLVDSLIFMMEQKISQKFFTASPLRWTLAYFMLFDGMWGIIGMIAGGAFTAVAKKLFKWSDLTIGVIGAVGHIGRDFFIAIARTTSLVYVAYAFGVPVFFLSTACRALMSKLILKDEQGKLFSLLAALEGFLPMLGSVIATAVFTATVDYWPGCWSLVAAFMAFIPLILLALAAYFMRRDQKHLIQEFAPDVSSSNLAEVEKQAAVVRERDSF